MCGPSKLCWIECQIPVSMSCHGIGSSSSGADDTKRGGTLCTTSVLKSPHDEKFFQSSENAWVPPPRPLHMTAPVALIQHAKLVSMSATTVDSVSVHGPPAPGAVLMIGKNTLLCLLGCALHMWHLFRDPTAARVQLAVQVQMSDALKTLAFEYVPAMTSSYRSCKTHRCQHKRGRCSLLLRNREETLMGGYHGHSLQGREGWVCV